MPTCSCQGPWLWSLLRSAFMLCSYCPGLQQSKVSYNSQCCTIQAFINGASCRYDELQPCNTNLIYLVLPVCCLDSYWHFTLVIAGNNY